MDTIKQIALACCVALCAACGDGSQPPQQGAPSPVSTAPVQPPTPPWPNLEKNTQVSGDLLARNYYLVFDASGSMNETSCAGKERKLQLAKQAVASFARSIPAGANVGLLVFGAGGIREHLPLAAASRGRLEAAINSVSASGGTPLRSSIALAGQALASQGERQLGYGEYHLVVITDGEYTPASEDPSSVVEQILTRSPIVIHTLGFCIGDKHSLNQPGRILYKAANNLQDLQKGLGEVLAESPDFSIKQFK